MSRFVREAIGIQVTLGGNQISCNAIRQQRLSRVTTGDATFSEFSPVVTTRCPLANEQDFKRAQSHVTGTLVKVPVLIHVSVLLEKVAGEVRRQTLWLNSQNCNNNNNNNNNNNTQTEKLQQIGQI